MAIATRSCDSTEGFARALALASALLMLAAPGETRAEEDETAASPPRPWHADLDAALGLGHDTNPTFSASPEARRAPGQGGDVSEPTPSPFAEMRVGSSITLGSRWYGRARLGWAGRQYFDGARQLEERLVLGAGLRTPTFDAGLSLDGLRYDRTETLDDAWGGRIRAEVGYRLFGVRLALHGTLGGRIYTAAEQRDRIAGGGLEGSTLLGPFLASAGFDLERRDSTVELASRVELTPWTSLGLLFSRWEVFAQYMAFLRRFDARERSGHEHVIRARSFVALVGPLWAMVSVEYGAARGRVDALAYRRLDVIGGVRVYFDHRSSSAEVAAAVPTRQGPARVEGREVTFDVPMPGAREVAVIGSFNDWDASRGQLTRGEDGRFRGRFSIPSGRHRYQLMVDGTPTVPSQAPVYVDDDFGGRHAVLYVP